MSALRAHPTRWLESLLDPGESWVEYGAALSASQVKRGDEVVTGVGCVAGQSIAVIAHNNTAANGYITSMGAQKILRAMDLGFDMGIPIVSLMSSPGVSIEEGISAGDGYARILRRTCELSGRVPQLASIMGVCVGGPAYSATLQDLVIFNRTRSHMMVSAPNVVKSVLGQDATMADLGGVKVHSETTGLAHFVEESVAFQIARLRQLIGFLPANHVSDPRLREPQPAVGGDFQLPNDLNRAYSADDLIARLVDGQTAIEYASRYGGSIKCVWAYIEGQAVAILVNNSEMQAGSLTVESSEKASRFIRISDAYNIPIVTLIDTPGFMPGPQEEQNGLLKSGARLCRAMQTRVPRLSVVLRKNYGAAAIVLTQTPGWGGDLVLALQGSSCAVMGFEAARQTLFGLGDMTEAELAEQRARYHDEYESPRVAYEKGFIDGIVAFGELRQELSRRLRLLVQKRDKSVSPVRGIEP